MYIYVIFLKKSHCVRSAGKTFSGVANQQTQQVPQGLASPGYLFLLFWIHVLSAGKKLSKNGIFWCIFLGCYTCFLGVVGGCI